MHSLTGAAREEAYRRLAVVCSLRAKGTYSEEEIAEKAGFGSVEAMHTQLGNWDLSGLLPKQAETSNQQPKRRNPGSGAQDVGTELPRPAAAAALFEDVVDALHRIIEDLEHYRLIRKDGRFISTYVNNEAAVYFPRASLTQKEWTDLSETYGYDPASKGITVFNAGMKDPAGGGRYPPRPLVILIAVYALLERDMRALLQVLHPNPSSVDDTRITGLIHKKKPADDRYGLIRTAEQLAELVCGGEGRRGAPVGDLSAREQNVACSITEYREQGWSDEQLYAHYAPLGFSRERVLELRRLSLRWPED